MAAPKRGEVLGILGAKATGKSSLLKILAGSLKPNLGRLETPPPDWKDIIKAFKSDDVKTYLQSLTRDNPKILTKVQHITAVGKSSKIANMVVGQRLLQTDDRNAFDYVVHMLDLQDSLCKEVRELSASELQRFLIALACVQEAEVYLFDEFSSHLDIR